MFHKSYYSSTKVTIGKKIVTILFTRFPPNALTVACLAFCLDWSPTQSFTKTRVHHHFKLDKMCACSGLQALHNAAFEGIKYDTSKRLKYEALEGMKLKTLEVWIIRRNWSMRHSKELMRDPKIKRWLNKVELVKPKQIISLTSRSLNWEQSQQNGEQVACSLVKKKPASIFEDILLWNRQRWMHHRTCDNNHSSSNHDACWE